ncbi:MAG: hypothetical protein IJK99_03620 [Bacteroidales bacterium]|nr:hypothetical protein [Bacteroidales bacterium]
MVRIWVEFGKKMVPGKQAVGGGRFWGVFGGVLGENSGVFLESFQQMISVSKKIMYICSDFPNIYKHQKSI